MSVSVLAVEEYEPTEYDAALLRDEVVVCVDAGDGAVRLLPLGNVVSVEGDADDHLTGAELPGWFHGGGTDGIVDLEQFPDLAAHVEDLDRDAP